MASQQPTLWSDPAADAEWLAAELRRRGWPASRVTEANTLSYARHFPDRAEALAAWEAVASGHPYRPKEQR